MKPLLLLHGALGAAGMFGPLQEALAGHYDLHVPDFSGHGANGPVDAYSIALFADDVLKYMAAHGLEQVSIFGYSMGGYVGAYVARHHPEKVDKLIMLATKWLWTEEIAARETGMLDPVKIEAKVPQLADALRKRHPQQNWQDVVLKTAAMMTEMGRHNPLTLDDLAGISQPVLVLLGDRDKMVGLEETVAAYKQLPQGRMGMIPGTPHPLEQADISLVSLLIKHFI